MGYCRKIQVKQNGFSLIELVIYIGVLSILLSAMTSVFTTILDVQSEATATSSVDQDGRYILAKLLHDFQASTPVVINTPSSPGSTTSSLSLTLNSDSTTSVYSINASKNLVLTNSFGANVLNSSDTSVATLSAKRIGTGGSSDTVEVSFTLNSRTRERGGYETKTFTSTFAGHN